MSAIRRMTVLLLPTVGAVARASLPARGAFGDLDAVATTGVITC